MIDSEIPYKATCQSAGEGGYGCVNCLYILILCVSLAKNVGWTNELKYPWNGVVHFTLTLLSW